MKKRIVMFLAATMVAICASADTWKDPDTGYTWAYRINGEAAEVYGFNDESSLANFPCVSPSPTGAVTVPSMLGGKPVTRIGDYAFQ